MSLYVPRALFRLPLLRTLAGLVVKQASPPAEQPDAPAEEEPSSRADQLREGMKAIRDDLAAFGTGVGVLAGSVTAAATLATFDDLFPLPAGWQGLIVLAVLLLAVAAFGSAMLTRRYFSARRRIVVETSALVPFGPGDRRNREIDPDDPRNQGIDADERIFFTERFEDLLRRENISTARELDRRIAQYEREAVSAGPEEAAVKRAEAKRLSDALDLAIAEGAISVLENRSAKVFKGAGTVVFGLMVAMGVGGLFLLGDWSRGERDRITAWTTCQKETVDAVQDQVCGQFDPRRLRDFGPSPSPAPS